MEWLWLLAACNMNVHKRCQKNVANNCGINSKQLAETLSAMGISGDKLNKQAQKKKSSITESPSRQPGAVTERSHTSPLPSSDYFSDSTEYTMHQFSPLSARRQITSSTDNRHLQDRGLMDRTETGRRLFGVHNFNFIKVLGKGTSRVASSAHMSYGCFRALQAASAR